MKICQFWGAENSCHWVRSMKIEYRKFPFSRMTYFKTELYRYVYIIIFGKHLSELFWIVLMYF